MEINGRKDTVLYIIVPCYNEEEVLPITSKLFLEELNDLVYKNKISDKSRIMFVNDGSKDKTWEIIKKMSNESKYFIGISQSRNMGHQNAVLAGLMEAIPFSDITISIDCDGQDDVKAMEEMVDAFHMGNEIVYGVRKDRKTDTFFKRFTAQSFYKILNLMGVEVIYNHADYRLISKKVLKEFKKFKEVNLFLRGIIPLVGFQSTSVLYKRHERISGESKYPLSKMLALAFEGITSLSIKPIRIIILLGMIILSISLISVLWCLVLFFLGKGIEIWTSLIWIICLMGGIQITSLGLIGEYVGKIYIEIKSRPRYIISERTWENN